MTSPAPAEPDQQPPQSTTQTALEATAAAVIAAQLAGMLGFPGFRWGANRPQRRAMLAAPQSAQIVATLGRIGVQPLVGRAVLAMTLTHSPIPGTTRTAGEGTAVRAMQTVNLTRRASYIVAASGRVQRSVNEAEVAAQAGATVLRPPAGFTPSPRPRPAMPTIPELPAGTPLDPLPGSDDGDRIRRELEEALAKERAYWNSHKAAQQKRDAAAKAVDAAKAKWGDTLSWVSRHDARVTKYCEKVDGTVFSASRMPPLGWPGSVHPACRCRPGPNRPGAKSTYDVPPIDD